MIATILILISSYCLNGVHGLGVAAGIMAGVYIVGELFS